MKEPGEILLISCYELGHQPFGLALPLAFLEEAGYRPETIDLAVESLDPQRVIQARFVAISVPMHTALRIGMAAAERVREMNRSCHIAFYGLYASLNEAALLKGVADAVIGGEYESSLLSLIESLSAGNKQPVQGVSLSGKKNEPSLTHLPFLTPSRSSLPPLSKYARLIDGKKERLAGYVEASRGCRHHCRHCPIPAVYKGRFFLLPKEVVLEDVKNLVAMGASHITFGDPDFLNGPVHSLRVARSLHQTFPNLSFDFTAKVEHLLRYQSLLPELADLGCLFIISAVESLNNKVLDCLAKNHTRGDAIEACRIVREAGMTLRPSLVPFTPWTSLEDLIDLFDVIEKEGMIDHVDSVQYTIRLLVPPGSLLLKEACMAPFLGPLDEGSFSYRWAHPDQRIDDLQAVFSQAVEAGEESGQDPETIFYQLKEYAVSTLEGRKPITIQNRPRSQRMRPPRMSEPWFCCAEPMAKQLMSIEAPTPKAISLESS